MCIKTARIVFEKEEPKDKLPKIYNIKHVESAFLSGRSLTTWDKFQEELYYLMQLDKSQPTPSESQEEQIKKTLDNGN